MPQVLIFWCKAVFQHKLKEHLLQPVEQKWKHLQLGTLRSEHNNKKQKKKESPNNTINEYFMIHTSSFLEPSLADSTLQETGKSDQINEAKTTKYYYNNKF